MREHEKRMGEENRKLMESGGAFHASSVSLLAYLLKGELLVKDRRSGKRGV